MIMGQRFDGIEKSAMAEAGMMEAAAPCNY
jgi:hypothetical protein